MKTLTIHFTEDFDVNGLGDAKAWEKAEAAPLTVADGASTVTTTARMLYSEKGLYILFDCEAHKLYAPENRDFAELYNQDVAEVFLQPDGDVPLYLEYEMCPLGAELPLMVINRGAGFHGWLPFHYEGERRIRHAAHVWGGERRDGAACERWTAECFIPFALFEGAIQGMPKRGEHWRGNFYRIEYEEQAVTLLNYAPITGATFHEPKAFAELVFE